MPKRTKYCSKHTKDRHVSRNGRKRGSKKGGAGGSFTWGRPGDEMIVDAIQSGDPNYDSEAEE